MLCLVRKLVNVVNRAYVCPIFMTAQLARKHRLLRTLTYRFPVMGVTVSSKKENKVVKRVPKPSFASFSTTGTLTTSGFTEEGENLKAGEERFGLLPIVKLGYFWPLK